MKSLVIKFDVLHTFGYKFAVDVLETNDIPYKERNHGYIIEIEWSYIKELILDEEGATVTIKSPIPESFFLMDKDAKVVIKYGED